MNKNSYLSADNKTNIAYYIFEDKQAKPVAVLQISHGMQEHILRYKSLVKILNKNGIVVCGNDALGHGETANKSGNWGYFASKDGYKIVLQDLYTMTKIAKNKYKNLPFFMLGHSMGSFFARYYAYIYPTELNGLILSGTASRIFGSSLALAIMECIKFFNGDKVTFNKLEDFLMQNVLNKYISDVDSFKEWITTNDKKLDSILKDKKSNFYFTASAYADLLKVLKFVNTTKWAKGIRKDLPILLCSGEKDPIGNYGKGVQNVHNLLKNEGLVDINIKLYKNARHELHSEKQVVSKEFFNDVITFIKNRI